MPKPYDGSTRDLVVFENWLSQLLGWLQLNRMDVRDSHMDQYRVHLLSQALEGRAITYYHQRIDDFQLSGRTWSFREAILDLRD